MRQVGIVGYVLYSLKDWSHVLYTDVVAPEKKNGGFLLLFLALFQHMVFTNEFSILVKELGLLTKLGQWISGLDVVGSYMYIVL
jgi:hypothetical protein